MVYMDIFITAQPRTDPAAAEFRMGSIDLVNARLNIQLLPAGRYGSVVQACPVKPQKLRLFRNRKLCASKINQLAALGSTQLRGGFFFEPLILSSKPADLGVEFIKFRFMYLLLFTLFGCIVFKNGGKPCGGLFFPF